MTAALAPNPVDRVRAVLDGDRAWMKGGLGNGTGRWCLVGAADQLVDKQDFWRVISLLAEVVCEQYPERIPLMACNHPSSWNAFVAVSDFNDDERTVWPEVDALLDKASVLYTERYEQVPA
jgi:hypothetical protein